MASTESACTHIHICISIHMYMVGILRHRALAPVEWLRGVLVLVSPLNCFNWLHKLGAWFFYLKIDLGVDYLVSYKLGFCDQRVANESWESPFGLTNMHTNSMSRFLKKNMFFGVPFLDPQMFWFSHTWDASWRVFSKKTLKICRTPKWPISCFL